MLQMKIKDQSIETLRGLAIILVVAGYIIKGDSDEGTHSIFWVFIIAGFLDSVAACHFGVIPWFN